MQFYINSEEVTKRTAVAYLTRYVMYKGYAQETAKEYMKHARRSEEAREIISEMTDYTLEMIAD